MELPRPLLFGAVLLVAVVLGPWLARVAGRLGTVGDAARPTPLRVAVMTAVFAGLLAGAVELTGARPATAALVWAAGAAVVLGAVDLSSHRLPDRVTYPTAGVCAAAFLLDAAVLGSWGALLRAVAAAVAAYLVGAGAAAISPEGLGYGDVKLLGLLGLVLGWFGWGVLLAGVFLGLLTGAVVSLALLAARRAGWRTALPFGPPLMTGAVLALALGATTLG
ncbi:A24 family peptidase [Blastococcus sp. CT_GayMR16]|uniref:prepilin peptidase n=1 Tax=Blastococcus sp. CT_GayMR16 TaxID=2559607 RepID=UPI0010744ACF|nr:A24 family peptidase [Blastococcus sp. CT_GayMR16]TFV87633.1 prepilin peptidase [Blastococcus sp. CT_GayMR16]